MRLLKASGSAKLGKASFWLCHAGLQLGDKKWDLRYLAKTDAYFLREKQLGKLGVEEEEPETKRRRGFTVVGLDLSERKEQVACHASALALAMTDEACRETEM